MAKYTIFILLLLLSTPHFAFSESKLEIDVSLSPAGSYKATTTEVNGSAYKTADGVAAENIIVNFKNLKTGIGLRDKHTRDRLAVDKYPSAKLVKAIGKNGKGEAQIDVRGKKIKVKGTYKIEGDKLTAEFPIEISTLDIKDVRYMGVGVKDTVTVHITVPLEAKRTAKK
ncbi:MAG: hypothetical protein A4S09_15060 [Proteobacteria bacterium SG_bin7]|nr:MAG: hypothetical protein A4S09_15060 [Proteobacteria bacterium SG_bin7]